MGMICCGGVRRRHMDVIWMLFYGDVRRRHMDVIFW